MAGRRETRRPARFDEYELEQAAPAPTVAQQRTQLLAATTRAWNKRKQENTPENKRVFDDLLRRLDALEKGLAAKWFNEQKKKDTKAPPAPKARTEIAWRPPTFEQYNYEVLKDDQPGLKARNEAAKEDRRREEMQRRIQDGDRRADVRREWRERDATGKAGRPPLQLSDHPEKIEYLNSLVKDKKMYGGTQAFFDYVKSDEDAPPGISRRFISRWRQSTQVFSQFARWTQAHDIMRRTVEGDQWRNTRWNIDLTSRKETPKKYVYILCCINPITGYARTVALKDKESKTVWKAVKFLLEHEDSKAVWPKIIQSDNGSEFIGAEFKAGLKSFNQANNVEIRQSFTPAGRPQANGSIEVFNRILKRQLAMRERDQPGDLREWSEYLGPVTEMYNDTKRRVTGNVSPMQAEYWLETNNAAKMRELSEHINRAALGDGHEQVNVRQERKFAVGDLVRHRVHAGAGLSKAAEGTAWSARPLKVSEVRGGGNTIVYYSLVDQANNPVKTIDDGDWTTDQLKLWTATQLPMEATPTLLLRRILRPCVYNGQQGYMCSWAQVDEGVHKPTCEPRTRLMEDVPQWVIRFEARHNVVWKANPVSFTWTERAVVPQTTKTATAAAAGP